VWKERKLLEVCNKKKLKISIFIVTCSGASMVERMGGSKVLEVKMVTCTLA
jgi:hypothetical protein